MLGISADVDLAAAALRMMATLGGHYLSAIDDDAQVHQVPAPYVAVTGLPPGQPVPPFG